MNTLAGVRFILICSMKYIERQPFHPLLKKCVACFWSITVPAAQPHARKVAVADLPDGHTEYLFNGSVPFFREVVNSPETSSTNFTSLLYAQKRSMSVVTISNTHLFCIRFKPFGLYHLAGVSLFEITGHALEPRFIFEKRATELEERILSVTDFDKRVIVAETVLAEMLKRSRAIATRSARGRSDPSSDPRELSEATRARRLHGDGGAESGARRERDADRRSVCRPRPSRGRRVAHRGRERSNEHLDDYRGMRFRTEDHKQPIAVWVVDRRSV